MMKTKYFFIILIFIAHINLSYTQCPIIADFNYNRLCTNGQVQFIDQSYFINPGLIKILPLPSTSHFNYNL